MIVGHIHSMESMGLVDGPGIRSVVFFQGCALRCKFCHNPDTWEFQGGEEMTPEALVKKISRFKPYFKQNGGVTFSGGEPLMQPEFLLKTLKLCKQEGIHTCIDTAGFGQGDYNEILSYTDLVLLDLKALERNGTKLWIRHVVVPGLTDSKEHMQELKEYIDRIPNVEKVELLPYHLLGTNKYEVMNLSYPLKGVPAMDKERTKQLQKTYFDQYGGKQC